MSDSLIAWKPRIDEPSKARPLSKTSWPKDDTGTVKCCSMPGRSTKRTSTNSTPSSVTYLSSSSLFWNMQVSLAPLRSCATYARAVSRPYRDCFGRVTGASAGDSRAYCRPPPGRLRRCPRGDRDVGPPHPGAGGGLVRLHPRGDLRARRRRPLGRRPARPASTCSASSSWSRRSSPRSWAARSARWRPGSASYARTATRGPIPLHLALARQVLIALVIPPLVYRPDGRGLHDLAAGQRGGHAADVSGSGGEALTASVLGELTVRSASMAFERCRSTPNGELPLRWTGYR